MDPPIHVGMAQMRVVANPARLICLGLGSCVAVALWDPSTKIGGLAHVMLPNEKNIRKKASSGPAKFGNIAVKALLEEMKKKGANHVLIIAKIAGGAHMFRHLFPAMEDIGKKNVESVRDCIKECKLRLISEDVGGSAGRTVELDTETGKLLIKSLHGATIML